MNDQKPPVRRSQPNSRPPASARPQSGDDGRFHRYRGVLLLALAALVIWLNSTFLIPLLMGAIFAIVLHPLMGQIGLFRIRKVWRAAVVTTLFAFAFLIPIGTIVFLGAEAGLSKVQQIQSDPNLNDIQFTPGGVVDAFGLRHWIERIESISPIDESQLRQMLTRGLATAGNVLVNILQKLLSGLPGAAFSTVITLITIFFLLVDGSRAVRFLKENSIFGPRQTDDIFRNVVSLCNSVIVASIAAGAVQALLIFVACLIAGIQNAFLISMVAFVLSFLPVIGTAPVTITLTLQAFIRGDIFSGFVFLIFIGLVGISDNIVRPYVLRGGASLHPLVGFVAAFGALDTIGFYGVFIGPVVAGLFFTLLPMVTRTYGRSPNLRV
jgi:predicted PurR-regulated permease PerM